jgi:hypothetical protein
MKLENIKAWAVVDSEVGLIGFFDTREAARNNKRYAAQYGHKQIVVKLKFAEVVR